MPVLDPKEWYDLLFRYYKQYHKDLDSFCGQIWKKFLPLDMVWKTVVDLGWWDGRLSSSFENRWIDKYISIDVSTKLLSLCKSNVTAIEHDLNNGIPLENDSADVVLMFFMFLYILDIQQLMENVYRIMKKDGVCLLFHHIERRLYKHKVKWQIFKIQNYTHQFNAINKLLDYNFFQYKILDIEEKGTLVWKLYVISKN